ncbi:MAG: sigma-70 family RNA polymerase sigma factor [Candidatus Moraniibacteriota bacterium]
MKEAPYFFGEDAGVADEVVNTGDPSRLPGAKYPLLARDENRALAAKAASGDAQALDLVLRHNMRLIYSVARSYPWSGIPIEDLVQEGVIGFMKAIEKFEVERGMAVSTYATWWVRQAISAYIVDNGKPIRLPKGIHATIQQIRKTQEKLLLAGTVPTDKGVARKLGITERQVISALRASRQNTPMVSLDDQIPDRRGGKSRSFGEMMVDSQAIDPKIAWMAKSQLTEFVQQVRDLADSIRKNVGGRAYQVFVHRYGISSDRTRYTLEATGEKMAITRERVRQIERELWRKRMAINRSTPLLKEKDFLRMLDSLSDLEELAQVEVDWGQILISETSLARCQLARASIEMLVASIKEGTGERDYLIFCGYYGLGQPKKNRKELAGVNGISSEYVYQVVHKLWEQMTSWSKYFNEKNLVSWLRMTT